jgi:hypothetical protein
MFAIRTSELSCKEPTSRADAVSVPNAVLVFSRVGKLLNARRKPAVVEGAWIHNPGVMPAWS